MAMKNEFSEIIEAISTLGKKLEAKVFTMK